jgi:hypothetical protein
MNCEPIRGLLSAYLDDQLSAPECQSVSEHLANCSECSAILSDYQRFDALLVHLPYLSPPSSHSKRGDHTPRHTRPHIAKDYQKAVLTFVPLTLENIATQTNTACYTHTTSSVCTPQPTVAHADSVPVQKNLVPNIIILLLISTLGLLLIYYLSLRKLRRQVAALNFAKIFGA